MKRNKVIRIALMGGLIGALCTNPRKALDDTISNENAMGWHCHQILAHSTTNLFMRILQLVALIVTLGLWTFGAGYLLLMEKEE